MKRLIILGTIFFLLIGSVFASTDSVDLEKKKIEELKNKIVEQTEKTKGNLNKVISGFVEKIEGESFILENQEKIELDPELTRYYEIKGNNIVDVEKEDFEKGDYIFALGPELDGKVNVLEVYKDEKFSIEFGVVVEVDEKGKLIRILDSTKTERVFNIAKNTKIFFLTDEDNFKFERAPLSKLKEGDYGVVVYRQEKNKKEGEVTASKILIIPQELIEKLHSEEMN